jgi:hypothetical protein
MIDVKDMSTGVDKLLRKLFADKEIVFLAHNAKVRVHGIIQTFRNIRKEF